jgi:MoaA/NifB/PqqE/SkfB family radical SAM enzyme
MSFINPQAKLYSHMGRLAVLKDGGSPPPINVEIDLSNRCSLGCEWCHFAFTHTRGPLAGKREKPAGAISGGDLMDLQLAKAIVDQLADAGVDSITWTGGGEPTLHPHFDEIVEYADGKIKQAIYTHGGHINEARAALLKRAMTFVYVSLDAAARDSYKRDKRVDRFDQVLSNVYLLSKADGPATIGIGYLMTEENWKDARYAILLAREFCADYIQFRPTIHYDQITPDRLQEQTGWLDEAIELLEEVAGDFDGFVIADLDRFRMYRDWDGHPYPTCWWSGLQTVITPNGKVWTCVNKREHPGAELGDLSVESFQALWGRRSVAQVAGDCRVMCRGHVANLALAEMMADRPHAAFV